MVTLTFDLLTLKVVPESRVTWATSVPVLVFLAFSVLDLGPIYATQTDVRQHYHLMSPPIMGGGIIIIPIFIRATHSTARSLLRQPVRLSVCHTRWYCV